MLTIAEDEVVYKFGLEIEVAEIGTEDSSDTAVPEPPPTSPLRKSGNQPHHHHDPKPEPVGRFPGETLIYQHLNFRKPPPSASRGVDGTSEPIFWDGAYHLWDEPGLTQQWTQKYPPGVGQANGPEAGRNPGNGESSPLSVGGGDDTGAHPEK